MANAPQLFDILPGGAQQVIGMPELVAIDVEDANRLGWRHYLSGDFPKAEECFIAVVKADPQHAFGWGNLGLTWQQAGLLPEALQCYRRSMELIPDNPSNLTNLGYLYDMMGHLDHAIRLYERALEIHAVTPGPEPSIARTKGNLGAALLRRFDFGRGWPLLEARFHTVPRASLPREYPFPRWDGKPVRRLAVWQEQGVGDQILYATLLPDLIGRGQDFVCELDARLIPAFQRSFPSSNFVPKGYNEHGFDDCDAHVPQLTLGEFLRPSIESFAGQPKRLLRADATTSTTMQRDIIERLWQPKKLVAISWCSTRHPPINRSKQMQKSAELKDFALLGARDDVRLVNVQYGDTITERMAWAADHEPIYMPPIDLLEDIDGVLAVIENCDVVVTTSNVTAHFAGALGKPTYLIYRGGVSPFHYWEPHNGRSLWYPSVQIVTAPTWVECIAAVNERL